VPHPGSKQCVVKSEEFKRRITKLETGSSKSMLLWAGGSAPFEYVRVHLVNEATKTVTIALGDAKHHSSTTVRAKNDPQNELVKDAKAAHRLRGPRRRRASAAVTRLLRPQFAPLPFFPVLQQQNKFPFRLFFLTHS
jgi:hypothetical protein